MNAPVQPTMTAGYYVQSIVSFAVAMVSLVVGIFYLPVDPWIRAFLIVAVLYAVTSAFVLAKSVRDRHESANVTSRVDQARLEKLIAGHDPFKVGAP
jgi:hypothetical protein